jgi:hypothetical protein
VSVNPIIIKKASINPIIHSRTCYSSWKPEHVTVLSSLLHVVLPVFQLERSVDSSHVSPNAVAVVSCGVEVVCAVKQLCSLVHV